MDRWVMQTTTTIRSWAILLGRECLNPESGQPKILCHKGCWHPGMTYLLTPQDLQIYSWRKNSKWKLYLGKCVTSVFTEDFPMLSVQNSPSLVLICCGWAPQIQAEGWLPKSPLPGWVSHFLMQLKAMSLTMVNIKSTINKKSKLLSFVNKM